MQVGNRVRFTKDCLYYDLKIKRASSLVIVEIFDWKYCWVQGIKYAPKRLAGKPWNMLVFRENLKLIG